jgi:hypothetical protein
MKTRATRRASPPRRDPRVIGGRYYSGYWRLAYTVLAIAEPEPGSREWTCQWADGTVTTHATAWDWPRDRVLEAREGPPAPGGTR